MMAYGTHNKRHDVSSNIPVAKLLELARTESGNRDIILELCTDKEADQWVEIKDPLALKKGDRLRVKKVHWYCSLVKYMFTLYYIHTSRIHMLGW